MQPEIIAIGEPMIELNAAEEGPLSDAALSWWSDRDGLLGRGPVVVLGGDTLSVGVHVVTLLATDTTGGEGSASASVAVEAPVLCAGDCNGNGAVTVDELVTLVNVALGTAPVDRCEAGDRNGSGTITVEELVAAVNRALAGCAS